MKEADKPQQSEKPQLPANDTAKDESAKKPEEQPQKLDPTRYGDWEKDGRCVDF